MANNTIDSNKMKTLLLTLKEYGYEFTRQKGGHKVFTNAKGNIIVVNHGMNQRLFEKTMRDIKVGYKTTRANIANGNRIGA